LSPTDADEAAAAADDAAAIAQVLAGDREAFGLLVARHARRVHDLARRMLRDAHEAEDAVQHAFLNAYRALPRFDPRRPFRHWLLRIASNLCRNRLAERRRRPTALGADASAEGGDVPAYVLDPEAPPLEPATGDPEGALRVRAAIDALTPPYRLVVVLRYVHELPLEAIAEITEQPLGTVKTHLFRARAALAALLRAPASGERPPDETSGRARGTS
jgi:RNA polymerase sigma-70 factor (ECF subfamily)